MKIRKLWRSRSLRERLFYRGSVSPEGLDPGTDSLAARRPTAAERESQSPPFPNSSAVPTAHSQLF